MADIRAWTLLVSAGSPNMRQFHFLTRLLCLVQVAGESPSPQKPDIERTASTSSNAPLLSPSQMSALSLASPKVSFALHAAGFTSGAVVDTGLLSAGSIVLFLTGLWLRQFWMYVVLLPYEGLRCRYCSCLRSKDKVAVI